MAPAAAPAPGPGAGSWPSRVTYRVDATETAEAEVVVDSADRLHAAVQEWLEAFLTGASS